jgi:hypothetical protein
MKGRAVEWRSRLLLASFSFALTLAGGELAARVLLRPTPPSPPEGTPISELSPTLGWRTRANGAQRLKREDFEVTISINRLGLRGPEIPYEPEPGARRLAIMGDSFAHGYYAEEPQTLRGRLAEALRPCRVDVLNAGGPGYSTDQEWIYFVEEIRKYHPSEVLLLFYYNDLQFNLDRLGTANRSKPVFVEKEGALQLVPPVIADRPARVREERTGERRRAPTFHGSALWSFATSRLQRSRPDWARSLSAWGLAPSLSNEPPAEYLPFAPSSDGERARIEEMWKRTTALIQHFRDDVRREGGSFTVFYVPARFEVNDEAWMFVQRRYGDRLWSRGAVKTRLQTVLASIDIPMIEADADFVAAEKSGPPAYLPIDGHWNARGNEIAFASVLPAMRRDFSCGS